MIVTVTLNPSLDEWVWVPRLAMGTLNRAVRFERYPGGKGINVARGLHELRVKTTAVALAGGNDGQVLGKLLMGQGIACRFVTIRGATRNNYSVQSSTPRAITQINAPGPQVARRDLQRLERLVHRLGAGSRGVVFSGSLPPGAPATTYARLLRAVRKDEVVTVLDASGASLRHGLSARPWLIKPNRHEAEELLGATLRTRREVVAAARELARRGPRCVVISMGDEGAVLAGASPPPDSLSRIKAGGAFFAASPRVTTDSPVGSGDSLVAGLLAEWLRSRSFPQALRWGVACGAACAMTPGTSLFRRADAVRLLRRVAIEAV